MQSIVDVTITKTMNEAVAAAVEDISAMFDERFESVRSILQTRQWTERERNAVGKAMHHVEEAIDALDSVFGCK